MGSTTVVQWGTGTYTADKIAGDPPLTWALINLGVNDIVQGLPSQATFETAYGVILDAVHTHSPSAHVYCTTPWLRGHETDVGTIAGWIANVVAARSSWASIGDDERAWLKGSDDGATNTADGTHYSAAGNAAKVVQEIAAVPH